MSYKIDEVEGIGPANAEKLAAAKIGTTDDLLEKCGSAKGRKATAEATGIGESMLLKWANMADLMRVSGIGKQFSELLKASGVDTVKELAQRNSDNLAEAMGKVNDEKKLARVSPSATDVAKWVAQAKEMDPRISH